MSEYLDNKQLFSSPKVGQYNNHMVMTNVVKPLKKEIFLRKVYIIHIMIHLN